MGIRTKLRNRQSGFTLVELTIVLVLIALLIGGLLVPLSAQRDVQNTNDVQKQLAEIKEALLGFAIINGRLPCPTTTIDPASANYGIEDAACASVEGYLPWKSLGVQATDPWGTRRSLAADPLIGYWHYRVDNAFSVAFTLNTTPTSALQVVDAAGNALTQASPNSPVAIVYSTGPDTVQNGQNAPAVDTIYQAGERSQAFDDIMIWISRPVLFNRMISAGKLP